MYAGKTGKLRIMAVVTAALTMATMTMTVTAAPVLAADSGITKDETVYVITSADGSQKEAIVSDHLQNGSGVKTIEDVSHLRDIENVKGNEKFKHDEKSGSLIWQAEGSDIYYQGRTDEKTPIGLSVKYYLDGREMSGAEIQGKSGRLKIDISYENRTDAMFLVMSGLVVENGCLKNTKISSGRIIDDGDKQFIAAMAVPGLDDKLGINGGDELLTDHVEITGDAENFSCEDIMTVAMNDVFDGLDGDMPGGLNMDAQIDELNDGAKQLAEGSTTLYNGVHMLNDKSQQLSAGVAARDAGAGKLSAGSRTSLEGSRKLAAGAAELSAGIETASRGAQQVAAGNARLAASLKEVQAGINGYGSTPGLVDGAKAVANGMDSVKAVLDNGAAVDGAVKTYLQNLAAAYPDIASDANYQALLNKLDIMIQAQNSASSSLGDSGNLKGGMNAVVSGLETVQTAFNKDDGIVAGADALSAGSSQVSQGLKSSKAGSVSLSSGVEELEAGADALAQGQQELSSGAAGLAAGMDQLSGSSQALIGGVGSLDLGAKQLNEGMSRLYSRGISKIVELYNGELKGLMNGLQSLGGGYDSFTTLPQGMDGSVKFIYKTEVTE